MYRLIICTLYIDVTFIPALQFYMPCHHELHTDFEIITGRTKRTQQVSYFMLEILAC
jgi:hypothetical protein